MRPGIGRIREVFDYEKLGGSPLLGVSGTVIITHGRAQRRMIGYAVGGGRGRGPGGHPGAIAEAFHGPSRRHRRARPAEAVAGARRGGP